MTLMHRFRFTARHPRVSVKVSKLSPKAGWRGEGVWLFYQRGQLLLCFRASFFTFINKLRGYDRVDMGYGAGFCGKLYGAMHHNPLKSPSPRHAKSLARTPTLECQR